MASFAKQGDERHQHRTDKPPLKLVGTDSNAFAVLSAAKQAAQKYGWTEDEWLTVKAKAMAGSYDHLLATILGAFDVEGAEDPWDEDNEDEDT